MKTFLIQTSMSDKSPSIVVADTLEKAISTFPQGAGSIYAINGTIFANGRALNVVPDQPEARHQHLVDDARFCNRVSVLY